mmetsp:Transcript_37409/g.82305  ORF Transcript_37409/g.82305 Transcript_37409/m.82305 type:complete len:752 (-) Transcript_37409:181-2436(-)
MCCWLISYICPTEEDVEKRSAANPFVRATPMIRDYTPPEPDGGAHVDDSAYSADEYANACGAECSLKSKLLRHEGGTHKPETHERQHALPHTHAHAHAHADTHTQSQARPSANALTCHSKEGSDVSSSASATPLLNGAGEAAGSTTAAADFGRGVPDAPEMSRTSREMSRTSAAEAMANAVCGVGHAADGTDESEALWRLPSLGTAGARRADGASARGREGERELERERERTCESACESACAGGQHRVARHEAAQQRHDGVDAVVDAAVAVSVADGGRASKPTALTDTKPTALTDADITIAIAPPLRTELDRPDPAHGASTRDDLSPVSNAAPASSHTASTRTEKHGPNPTRSSSTLPPIAVASANGSAPTASAPSTPTVTISLPVTLPSPSFSLNSKQGTVGAAIPNASPADAAHMNGANARNHAINSQHQNHATELRPAQDHASAAASAATTPTVAAKPSAAAQSTPVSIASVPPPAGSQNFSKSDGQKFFCQVRRELSAPGASTAASSCRLSESATNKNQVVQYAWMAPLFARIVSNDLQSVRDLGSGCVGTPLFVVAGACPNPFCGMQAVMYAMMSGKGSPYIDFWWIKPMASNKQRLEPNTLDRHPRGEFKNDPGRSRALYAQFSDLFAIGSDDGAAERSHKAGGGLLRFEVVQVDGSHRAVIHSADESYFVYLIWQEDWTSNPLSRSKYIKGKLVYQTSPHEAKYFSRPYAYRDGVLSIPAGAALEEDIHELMPSNSIQRNCIMD